MFERITTHDKSLMYPSVPDYSSASTELFLSAGELVCFAKVDTSSTVRQQRESGLSYFFGPQNLIWVPGNTRDHSTDKQHNTTIAMSLFQFHGTNIRVFVSRTADDDWVDAGSGILNGILQVDDTLVEINVRLCVKLPEMLWLTFGGHSGWDLVINGDECNASSPNAVVKAIREAWSHPPVDLEIGRYTGDTLFAIADNFGRATVSYWTENYWTDRATFVSRSQDRIFKEESTYIFLRSNTNDHEVPVEQVVTTQEALSIIENYVMTGIPTGLSQMSRCDGKRADE